MEVAWGFEISQKVKSLLEENKNDPDRKYDGGESIRDLWARVGSAMKHLKNNHEGQTVLVVTHEHFIKAFVVQAIFGGSFDMSIYRSLTSGLGSNNTGVTQLNFDPSKGWKLVFWNDVSHIASPDALTG